MKDLGVTVYTSRFNYLANLYPRIVNPKYKKFETYISGLAPLVQSLVTTSRPLPLIVLSNCHIICLRIYPLGYHDPTDGTETDGGYKTELPREVQTEFQPPQAQKRTSDVYATIINTPTPSKTYIGTLPNYSRCNYHHVGNCRVFVCNTCNLKDHFAKLYRKTPTIVTYTPIVGRRLKRFKCNQPGKF